MTATATRAIRMAGKPSKSKTAFRARLNHVPPNAPPLRIFKESEPEDKSRRSRARNAPNPGTLRRVFNLNSRF